MGTVSYIKDTLSSFVNNLGKAGQDKAASVGYTLSLLSDQELQTIYRDTWLAGKIIDIPAFDSVRRWRDWQANKDTIKLLEAEEKRLGLKRKLLRTMIRARLFGGAALYIGTGDANPEKPLDPATVKKQGIRFLTPMLRKDLTPGDTDQDPESEYFGQPAWYTFATGPKLGLKIHPSRLVIFQGRELPDDELQVTITMGGGKGWGDSVLQAVITAVKNSDSTTANVASLVFEAKVDIVRIPDMMSNLANPEYEERLLRRFSLANVAKGVASTLLLDKEEEYESKATSFQNLPDVMDRFMQLVSGASDIPVTRLLGQSPAGMNSTGESDLRNYYDRVQSMQNNEITPAMNILDECLIRSATGTRDEDLHYIWASLWQLTDKERADIGKINAETITTINNTGLYPQEAVANAGANMLVENGVFPGLLEEIGDAGGLPDYEAEAEKERQNELAQVTAVAAAKGGGKPTVDAQITDGNMKTLYVRRDVVNADEIKTHYKKQGVIVTVEDLHITIIHSSTALDWFKTGEPWDEQIELVAGGPRDHEFFGPPGAQDTLVLMVKSESLEWRHRMFLSAGAKSSYEEFQPHISLRYGDAMVTSIATLEPYRGKIVLGPEIYEEIKA